MAEMKPSIGGDGVPRCSENECPSYDGKRCELIGCRPSVICEPAVIDMADRLRLLLADDLKCPWPVRAYVEWDDDCGRMRDDNDVPRKNLRAWIMEKYGI